MGERKFKCIHCSGRKGDTKGIVAKSMLHHTKSVHHLTETAGSAVCDRCGNLLLTELEKLDHKFSCEDLLPESVPEGENNRNEIDSELDITSMPIVPPRIPPAVPVAPVVAPPPPVLTSNFSAEAVKPVKPVDLVEVEESEKAVLCRHTTTIFDAALNRTLSSSAEIRNLTVSPHLIELKGGRRHMLDPGASTSRPSPPPIPPISVQRSGRNYRRRFIPIQLGIGHTSLVKEGDTKGKRILIDEQDTKGEDKYNMILTIAEGFSSDEFSEKFDLNAAEIHEESCTKNVMNDPVCVLVTGAAGQIGSGLVFLIAGGQMLGSDQPVILHMLDIPEAEDSLNRVNKELTDAAFPLLKDVVATTDTTKGFAGVDIVIMAGGFPRKEGMEKKDVLCKNVAIYRSQASDLEKYASANCKVLVIDYPANTNALILKEFAPSFPHKNISSLTRLDQNIATGLISQRLSVQVNDVRNMIIWGNQCPSQYLDVNHATVTTSAGYKSIRELVADDAWLNGDFISTVQGAAISALSVATSVCDHIRDWVRGTPEGTWVSMGVYSDGSYDVPAGLIFSFPVTSERGEWKLVEGLHVDEISRNILHSIAEELSQEKELAYSCLA